MLIKISLTALGSFLYTIGFPSFLSKDSGILIAPLAGLILWIVQLEFSKKDLPYYFVFFLGVNIIGHHWLIEMFQTFGELSYPISFLIFLLFTIIVQIQFWPMYFLGNVKRVKNLTPKNAILFWSLILTLSEHFLPQQFMGHISHHWLSLSPYLGLAPILGTPGFSFISYLFIFSLVYFIKRKYLNKLYFGVFLLFILLNLSFPLKYSAQAPFLNYRIVQANIANYLKITSERGEQNSIESVKNIFENLSVPSKNDLIIWPETSYPYSINLDLWEKQSIHWFFDSILKKSTSDIFFGGYLSDHRDFFNSSFLLESSGKIKGVQNKHILIPFGETLPFGPLNGFIKDMIPTISLFSKGTTFSTFNTKKDFSFGSAICYEILNTSFIRTLLNTINPVDFIINVTNDSWFGDTLEPYQHLFLGKWRAIEFQIPIIRSTNTGISTIIYPDGSIGPRLSLGKMAYIDGQISKRAPYKTPYQRGGIINTLFLFLILFVLSNYLIKIE